MFNKKIIQFYQGLQNTISKIQELFLSDWMINFFKNIAFSGRGSNRCLKEGFLPVPVHFYSPIPDINDLEKRKIWDKKSRLSGIDFNKKNQLILLKKLGQNFSQECQWSLEPTNNPADFYVDNQGFSYGCAAALHSVIRYYKPKKVIEIGSGNSSQVIVRALKLNKEKEHQAAQYIVIDPYPTPFLTKRYLGCHKILKQKVEMVKPEFFDQLGKDDILFIDSGHTVRIGGDVNFLYLDVLPRLKPGVLVHIHDIGLPYEYPKAYATNEVFRQFWTEQYLLQSFLVYNQEFEILLAMNHLMIDHKKDFQKAFPLYDPKIHKFVSGSFWIRRKGDIDGE